MAYVGEQKTLVSLSKTKQTCLGESCPMRAGDGNMYFIEQHQTTTTHDLKNDCPMTAGDENIDVIKQHHEQTKCQIDMSLAWGGQAHKTLVVLTKN